MRYWPVPSLTAVRTFSIRTGLDASTVTPGSTAPELSLTRPVIDACAYADAGIIASQTRTNRILFHAVILPPGCCDRVRKYSCVRRTQPVSGCVGRHANPRLWIAR